MKFLRALTVQLRQAVTWKILVFAAVFALVQAGAAAGFMKDEFTDVWLLMLMGSTSGADYLTIFVLPTLPFSMALAQDWESHAVPYWTVRTGVTRYTVSKLLSAGIAGFLTVGCGLTLLCGALRIWYPWYDETGFSTIVYERTLLESGHVFFGFLGYILHHALSGAIIGMFGMLVTCYIPNPFVAVAAPLSIDLTVSRLLSRVPTDVLSIWNYSNWFTGVHDAPTAGQVLLEKALLTFGLCLLMCIAGVCRMKRRVNRA